MSQKPRILIFTGDGKGKTTAALGMAFRAAGHGLRSSIVQFIKSDTSVGEIAAAENSAAIEIHTTGLGFLPPADDPHFTQHRAAAQASLAKAVEILTERKVSLLILDEICLAVARGLLEERQVLDFLNQAPSEICLVLTGRYATPALVAAADTVTEMLSIKHGLATGITAQKGVER